MAYGSGGRYEEELNPSGSGSLTPYGYSSQRREGYPEGKNGGVTGTLSMYLPGSGKVVSRRAGAFHPRSAVHCGDRMAAIGPTTYKKSQ